MRGSADVVTGMRNTREEMIERERLASQPRGAAKSRNDLIYGLVRKKFVAEKQAKVESGELRPSTPYDVIFQSRYRKHRIQVTAPADRMDPSTGIVIRARPLVAPFEDGIFRIPRRVPLADAEFMLQRLREHPAYGVGRDFWEQADAIDEGKIKATADSIALLASSPDIKEAVLAVLDQKDFDLSDRQVPAQPVASKPARAQSTERRPEQRPSQPVLAPSDLAPLAGLPGAPAPTPPEGWRPPKPAAPKRAARKK